MYRLLMGVSFGAISEVLCFHCNRLATEKYILKYHTVFHGKNCECRRHRIEKG